MLIHELCKECGITKKAVNYYLEQGLLEAKKGENGYRQFTKEDAAFLKEVTLLRKLGAGIPDIRRILAADDRKKALTEFEQRLHEDLERMKAKEEVMAYWIRHADEPEKAFRYAAGKLDGAMSLKTRLTLAFPGNYGLLLSLHFGPFLDEPAKTPEQEQAYDAILSFLDEVETEGLPPELAHDLQEAFQGLDGAALARMAEGMKENVQKVDRFLEENRERLKDYLRYRQSEEFLSSPAYRLSRHLLAFQEASGYRERFLPNLKILSPAYREFTDRLTAANERLLAEYPEAEILNGTTPRPPD